jgi:hypothetical protein
MTHKIIFIAPFYCTCGAHPLCLRDVSHHGAIKQVVTPAQPTSSHTISLCSSTSFPTVEEKERENRETDLERQRVVVELTGSCPSFLFCLLLELSWPASEVTQEHLQNIVSNGYMIAAEFATCLVPVDHVSPTLAKEYIVVCAAFYERGFSVPSSQFLHSLLQSYGLYLHHLTPSGILHMAAFVTLCETYIGIEPPLNQWSHFFLARLWQCSDVGAASLGSVDISVCSRPRAESYFSILQPDPLVRWWKA